MVDGVSYRAVWVQCDRCKKWRQAPDWTIHPDETVPWFCEVRAPPGAQTHHHRSAGTRTHGPWPSAVPCGARKRVLGPGAT